MSDLLFAVALLLHRLEHLELLRLFGLLHFLLLLIENL